MQPQNCIRAGVKPQGFSSNFISFLKLDIVSNCIMLSRHLVNICKIQMFEIDEYCILDTVQTRL